MIEIMRRFLKGLFASERAPAPQTAASLNADSAGRPTAPSLRFTAASLLVETAYADLNVKDVELKVIREILSRHIDLDEESTRKIEEMLGGGATDNERIGEMASRLRMRFKADESSDIERLAATLRQGLDEQQKILLMSLVWKIIYADSQLEASEGRLARKIQGELGLTEHDGDRARIMAARKPA